MINKDNFRTILKTLGFEERGSIFTKHFSGTEAYLKVDFENEELVYPIDKGFKISGEFTCNFTSEENFVVFECVNRLFEKGYKPEHIELEPKWKVGHGASGGRADILVRDNSGKSLLIIECKTDGNEFKKEWANTLQRGGQLLSYAKQAGSTQYVCLYASSFSDGIIHYKSNIISLKDNEKLLDELKDRSPLSFAKAKALDVEDIYSAWKETYRLDFASKGIFEEDIQPYHIGKQKFTVSDLVDVGSKDIQSKYHEFATIMRQHNVSGRENAFDKLVNLFLCKIVDETKNPNDLSFYWKGIAYDSYFDLQDRLQLLYQAGMKEFLGEEVTYIDNSTIDKAFRYFKKDPDATRETIKKYFRQLKFFTNNDFAFIDVHNEKLFYQNSAVLLKIVQMLQDTRLQSENQNQFLGDMFEGFLDQGVKQSEGQFFTPMPIVKFILSSLPLESIVEENELPPKVLDYACGAGHFLNELALQIRPFVAKHKATDVREYYKQITGVEKEYRLSKVAKVSAFMYGQDEIKITYADALGKKAKLEEGQYSVLVANPPYAVKGFLQTLSSEERKLFTLMTNIDEKSLSSNNSIEAFFIERAKQLLKPGAVAGIILPSSILSNDASIYINTREILIKYFQIVAITEFGSQTFGKTGTNTITLFLKRKEENPAPADHWKNRVDSWFSDNEADIIYNDKNYITDYCNHIGVAATQYKTLLTSNPSDELLSTEIFCDYKKAFDNLSEIKKLVSPKGSFSKRSKIDQEKELRKRLIEYLQVIEKDKLYYYVLASENRQKVFVARCPSDNKEQKQFLGYEWSSAKGSEGIKYINQTIVSSDIEDSETKEMLSKLTGLHHINTPLYSPKNRHDHAKINYYILQHFLGNELTITDELQAYVGYYHLTDMLEFRRISFNKQIQITPNRSISFKSRYELVKLAKLVTLKGGDAFKERLQGGKNANDIPFLKVSDMNLPENKKLITRANNYVSAHILKNEIRGTLFPKDTIIFPKVGKAIDTNKKRILTKPSAIDNNIMGMIVKDTEILLPAYLLEYFTNYVDLLSMATNANPPSISAENAYEVKIPLPPFEVQTKIVSECTKAETDSEKAEKEVEKAEAQIADLFSAGEYEYKKLNEVIKRQSEQIDPSKNVGEVFYVGLENIESNTGKLVGEPLTHYSTIKSNKNVYKKGDILYGKLRPNLNKLYLAKEDGICSTDILVFRSVDKDLNLYFSYFLRTKTFNAEVLKTVSGQQLPRTKWNLMETIRIPVPKTKKRIAKELEKLEKIIVDNQTKIHTLSNSKKEVLEKYLAT